MAPQIHFDFEINGETVEFEVEGTFSRQYAGRYSGAPEDCYEAEGGELEDMTISRVHAHPREGGGHYHTTEPCSASLLYELICTEHEGWDLAKAEAHVEKELIDHAAGMEPEEPDYPEPDDCDDPRDDYIFEGP
jgi:hypothetical protein